MNVGLYTVTKSLGGTRYEVIHEDTKEISTWDNGLYFEVGSHFSIGHASHLYRKKGWLEELADSLDNSI